MVRVDIEKMSIVELKALAYDTLQQVELLRQNLTAINQEIAKRAKQPEPKDETEK